MTESIDDGLSPEDEEDVEGTEGSEEVAEDQELEPEDVATPTELGETEVIYSEPYRLPEGLVVIPEE